MALKQSSYVNLYIHYLEQNLYTQLQEGLFREAITEMFLFICGITTKDNYQLSIWVCNYYTY